VFSLSKALDKIPISIPTFYEKLADKTFFSIHSAVTLHQLKTCECCSVSGVRELPVELVCDDNYKFIKNFNVPASCSCSKCGIEEQLNKLRAAF
jgi:hypothetical protein